MSANINLKSSVNEVGKQVTQIIHFVGGVKKTFVGVLPETISQGQLTKFKCSDGRLVMINDENVLCVEVFSEDD
tara:strand:+ start:6485 stop:6706 length:222 start_codon:yes stop_codon:yes gene_type:complete